MNNSPAVSDGFGQLVSGLDELSSGSPGFGKVFSLFWGLSARSKSDRPASELLGLFKLVSVASASNTMAVVSSSSSTSTLASGSEELENDVVPELDQLDSVDVGGVVAEARDDEDDE